VAYIKETMMYDVLCWEDVVPWDVDESLWNLFLLKSPDNVEEESICAPFALLVDVSVLP